MLFGKDDPLPPTPPPNFISSDFGNSHDLAGLGFGARAPPHGHAAAQRCTNHHTYTTHLAHRPEPAVANVFHGTKTSKQLIIYSHTTPYDGDKLTN